VIIPTGKERAERAEKSRRNAIPRLREMGLTNEQIAEALGLDMGEV
jgi:predicted transposase YdaD